MLFLRDIELDLEWDFANAGLYGLTLFFRTIAAYFAVTYACYIMLMLVWKTLTLMQGHSGSANAKYQRLVFSATKQVSIKFAQYR